MADKDHPQYKENEAINEKVDDHAFDGHLGIRETYRNNSLDDEDHYDEEVAEEAVLDRRALGNIRDEDDDDVDSGTGIGWLALVLSIVGLFFLPVIMGAAGIIIGIIARRQGARALGGWAIGIGIFAIVIRLFTADRKSVV